MYIEYIIHTFLFGDLMGIKEAEEYRCKCLKPFRDRKKNTENNVDERRKNKPF